MFHTTFNKEKKQWNGLKLDTVWNPKTSLGNVILSVMQLHGPRVAQVCADTGKCTTFQELRNLTICAATNLRNLGLHKGNVVNFVTNNSNDIAALASAILCLGCTITRQPTDCAKADKHYFLNLLKPDFVICDIEYYTVLKECLTDLKNDAKVLTFGGQIDDSYLVDSLFQNTNDNPYFVPVEINGETDIAFIITTSGSTNKPKGVRLSHACVLDRMSRLSEMIGASDVVLGYNFFGVISTIRYLMGSLLNGATRIVNQGEFSAERHIELIEKFKVTYTFTQTLNTLQLLNHPKIETADFSSIRHYTSGGGTPFDIIQKMNLLFTGGRFNQHFGMSEAGGTIAVNLHRTTNESVGQLISGCEAKIISEHGDRLGVNENGEFCIKFPFMFNGYVCEEDDEISHLDDEGFFSTGDMAYFDENGDLFVVDRKKNIFRSSGHDVIPSEIERFLNRIEGVMLSCVVPIVDHKGDCLPAAVVVKTKNSKCVEESIYKSVSNNFVPYKWLRGGVYFVHSIPTLTTSKIDRHLVARMAAEFCNKTKKSRQ